MLELQEGQQIAPEKPCLVSTERGFSLSYQGRFLYSKYAPDRAILGTIQNLTLLPGTLIIAVSPALWLGLDSLLEKLPENCFLLGVEFDEKLHDFADSELKKITENLDSEKKENLLSKVALLPYSDNDYIVNILSGEDFPSKNEASSILPHISTFRRAIPLEMSAGSQFNKEKYRDFASQAENTIASFWKNRITLTKLGRLYSRNLFKNLGNLSGAIDFRKLSRTVSQPIFVFGAGESIEETIQNISRSQLEKCFIIAVDAAAPALKAFGLRIDAIIAVEGQLAIEKAYIGASGKDSLIIADITSRPQVTRHRKKALTFFASKYTDSSFFKNLSCKAFFPPVIPPLGSVGLTAIHIAGLLRKNQNVPIFVSGLDFSFSLGRTHGKNTPAHIARLSAANRFSPAENYAAAFRAGAKAIAGKNAIPVITDQALSGYALSFADFFKGMANLYDCGKQGLPLSIQEISSEKTRMYLETIEEERPAFTAEEDSAPEERKSNQSEIHSFLESEEKALNRIKELLMFGNDVASCSCSLEDELTALISPREYLFLHFPDGYKCESHDISFLKRVRSQIDFFLKDIKNELKK